MMLLRSDLSQLQRPPKAFRRGFVIRELLLQLTDDSVEKMMRLDQLATGHRFDGVERRLCALHVGDSNCAV